MGIYIDMDSENDDCYVSQALVQKKLYIEVIGKKSEKILTNRVYKNYLEIK